MSDGTVLNAQSVKPWQYTVREDLEAKLSDMPTNQELEERAMKVDKLNLQAQQDRIEMKKKTDESTRMHVSSPSTMATPTQVEVPVCTMSMLSDIDETIGRTEYCANVILGMLTGEFSPEVVRPETLSVRERLDYLDTVAVRLEQTLNAINRSIQG